MSKKWKFQKNRKKLLGNSIIIFHNIFIYSSHHWYQNQI